jgi:hypothetical protein
MRDLGNVYRARNTQFEQEFFGLFLGETVSALQLERSHRRFLRRGLSGGTRYGARGEIFYTIQPPSEPHELMPSQPALTTVRECSSPPRQREPWPPS